jgi:hypothetical protein
MADIKWDHKHFLKSTETKALDGVEEVARGPMATTAKERCPVDHSTLRGSIGVERDDAGKCVYIGAGGPAAAYAFRQHQDMSLNHPGAGQAKFITSSIEAHEGKLKATIEKHIKS